MAGFIECWFQGWLFREMWRAMICLIILIILGPILFIIGMSMLFGAPLDNTRSDNIRAANNVVSDWNSFNKAQWENLNVYVDTTAPGFTARSLLPEVSGSSEIKEKDVDRYQSVKYQDDNILWPSNVGTRYQLNYYVAPTDPNTTVATRSVSISPSDFVVYQTEYVSDPDRCASDGGLYQGNGNCQYSYILTEVCVKFKKSGSTWNAENEPGTNVGCYYQSAGGKWSPLFYRKASSGQTPVASDIKVTARSSYDPLVYVEEITEGTGDFGLTKAQRAASGLALMIVGVIFMLPCCLFIGCTVYYYKYRKNRH